MIIARYFVVGGVCAALDFITFAALLNFTALNWFVSATLSFLAATTLNYFLSVYFVFTSGVRFAKQHEVGLVFLVSAMGLAMNQLALWVFFQGFGVNVYLAKILATGAVFFWNFGARRYFIFKQSA